MNWLVLVVAGVILLGALIGYARGGLRLVVSLLSTVITIAAVLFITPYVSKAVTTLTPADEIIKEQCLIRMNRYVNGEKVVEENKSGLTEKQVRAILKGAGISEKKLKKAGITVKEIANGEISAKELKEHGISSGLLIGHQKEEKEKPSFWDLEVPRDTQIQIIKNVGFPEKFQEILLENNNDEGYSVLGANNFAEYVCSYIAKLIIDLLSFVITFIVVLIVIRAVVFAFDIVSELPVLGTLNRIAGIFVGSSVSIILVDVAFILITVCYSTQVGSVLMEMIVENEFLMYLYQNNYLMGLLTKLG